jgi:YbbR domain-containing protein
MAYNPFRHPGLKLTACALAALLWLTVAGEHVVERIIRVPLEFRNIPPQLEVVGEPPGTVDVRLRGSSALLSRLEPGEVVAVLDLRAARPGSRLYHVRNEDVRSPYGVQVTQVSPGTLGLELEKSGRRILKVRAALEGEPAPGFMVGPVEVEPTTVEVVGPESRVKKLAEATTEPVILTAATGNVRDIVAVGVTDAAVRLAQPQDVTVTVTVLPAPEERELTGVPVRARNLGHGLHHMLSPQTITVAVRGRRDALEGVRADAVNAFVDLAGLGTGRYNLRVQFDSSQFGVTRSAPQVIEVIIK